MIEIPYSQTYAMRDLHEQRFNELSHWARQNCSDLKLRGWEFIENDIRPG